MMKKLLILWSCVALTAITSCDKEEYHRPNLSELISPMQDFTDPRDGSVYPCVRIGNQIWMTKNLCYQLPGHAFKGCFTWEEAYPNLERIKIALDDETFKTLALEVASDPQYDWGLMGGNIALWFDMGLPQETIRNFFEYIPGFPDAFAARENKYKETPEAQEIIGKTLFDQAEEKNGHYTQKYGFLYSYKAALAAVPEGWRLPSDEDWMKLETILGMPSGEVEKLEAWRGNGLATLLGENGESGLNLQRGGANVFVEANEEKYLNKDEAGYYWSSTKFKENDSTEVALFRMSALYSDRIWRGTSRITTGRRDVLYSVRCVREAR